MVISSREDAQVAGSSDRSSVLSGGVSNGGGVTSDGSLFNAVTGRCSNQETILADNSIDVGSWALKEVEESTGVQVRLFEVQVELSTLGLGLGEERTKNLSLQTLGNGVVELNLGVESIDGVPGLGDSNSCKRCVNKCYFIDFSKSSPER